MHFFPILALMTSKWPIFLPSSQTKRRSPLRQSAMPPSGQPKVVTGLKSDSFLHLHWRSRKRRLNLPNETAPIYVYQLTFVGLHWKKNFLRLKGHSTTSASSPPPATHWHFSICPLSHMLRIFCISMGRESISLSEPGHLQSPMKILHGKNYQVAQKSILISNFSISRQEPLHAR